MTEFNVPPIEEKEKFLSALKIVKNTSNYLQLMDQTWLQKVICNAGLVRANNHSYGEYYDQYSNSGAFGIFQHPFELAKFLIWCTAYKINSYLEIGIWTGCTFSFVSTYLTKFNPGIRCTATDVKDHFDLIEEVRSITPNIEFVNRFDLGSDRQFDLVFIDGDHTYDGAKRDWIYALTRCNPGLIALHDILEGPYTKGCFKLFKELEEINLFATFDSGHRGNGMGIGVCVL